MKPLLHQKQRQRPGKICSLSYVVQTGLNSWLEKLCFEPKFNALYEFFLIAVHSVMYSFNVYLFRAYLVPGTMLDIVSLGKLLHLYLQYYLNGKSQCMLMNHKLAEAIAFFNGGKLFRVWRHIRNISVSSIGKGQQVHCSHSHFWNKYTLVQLQQLTSKYNENVVQIFL